jgi:homoserine kinase type II
MAVYTDISSEELEAFLADYELGRLLSVKGIAEGVENSNFVVHTEAGTFILTLYEKRVAPEDLPFFLGLMDHLAAQGLNCPQPVKTRGGVALGRLAGRPAAMVTFLEGVSVRRPTEAQCGAVGAALADLHRAGSQFPMRRPNALSCTGWGPLFQISRAQADTVACGLSDFLAAELAYLERAWPTDLESGIIHADLFPDNVLFLGDSVSGLIDFYFACTDALAYDLAICLNAWCFEPDGAYNITKGARMIDAYQTHRRLTPREIAALPLLARGAALRFALTRLVDWLNVPTGALVRPKNPLEYVQKLRFHQRIASAAELGVA